MSPHSCSGINSFSFCIPASRPCSPSDKQASNQPPSDQLLSTVTAKTSTIKPVCIATLPTMLMYLIKTWLNDKETLQLLLTSHHMHKEVQSFYRRYLRSAEAQRSFSPIASFQNPVNLLPRLIGLGTQGELTFRQCQALQASGMSEAEYCSGALRLLQTRLSQPQDPRNVGEIAAGVTLGLGGSSMTATRRTVLLDFILGTCQTSHPICTGDMLTGFSSALGGARISNANLQAMLEKILGSCNTSTPTQMGYMIMGLCSRFGKTSKAQTNFEFVFRQILNSRNTSSADQLDTMIYAVCDKLGGLTMAPVRRNFLLHNILGTHAQCSPAKYQGMIRGLCHGLGARDMAVQQRDGLLQKIRDFVATNPNFPLVSILNAVWAGLGGSHISEANLNAILALIFELHDVSDGISLGTQIGVICRAMGAANISAAHRDTVLAQVLTCRPTVSAQQMGSMIYYVVYVLVGDHTAASTELTRDHLDVVIRQIVHFYQTTCAFQPCALQTGVMIVALYSAQGRANMPLTHRAIVAARIQESEHCQNIIDAIKLTVTGRVMVRELQLEPT